jgi:hypothetical protein
VPSSIQALHRLGEPQAGTLAGRAAPEGLLRQEAASALHQLTGSPPRRHSPAMRLAPVAKRP